MLLNNDTNTKNFYVHLHKLLCVEPHNKKKKQIFLHYLHKTLSIDGMDGVVMWVPQTIVLGFV